MVDVNQRDRAGLTYAQEMGERLAIARKAAGLSQVAFARRLGIGNSRLNNWESGRHSIPPDFVPKIYLETGITADWLFLAKPDQLPFAIYQKLFGKP